ncbi:MAG: hypothetical protein AB7W47_00605 [Calditrichaceae bacterium]
MRELLKPIIFAISLFFLIVQTFSCVSDIRQILQNQFPERYSIIEFHDNRTWICSIIPVSPTHLIISDDSINR